MPNSLIEYIGSNGETIRFENGVVVNNKEIDATFAFNRIEKIFNDLIYENKLPLDINRLKDCKVQFPAKDILYSDEQGYYVNANSLHPYQPNNPTLYKCYFNFDWSKFSELINLSNISSETIEEWKNTKFNSPIFKCLDLSSLTNFINYPLTLVYTNLFTQIKNYIINVYAELEAQSFYIDDCSKLERRLCTKVIGFKLNTSEFTLDYPFDEDLINSIPPKTTFSNVLSKRRNLYFYKANPINVNSCNNNMNIYIFNDSNYHDSDNEYTYNAFKYILIETCKMDFDFCSVQFELIPFNKKYSSYNFSCDLSDKNKVLYAIVAYFSSCITNKRQMFKVDESFQKCGIYNFYKGSSNDYSILNHDPGTWEHQTKNAEIQL